MMFCEKKGWVICCEVGRFIQKLNYMHYNPTQGHWKLCEFPEEYKFSSFRFYEFGDMEFEFLSHYEG